MKSVIPFTKDILFKSKIADITSISLEHEINIDDGEVKGNFIVSGEYKTHSVSINKEKFEYKLPFNVEITEDIDLDTLNFEIVDFYYDVVDNDVLRVNIEFEVSAKSKVKEEIKEIEEERIIEFEEPSREIKETALEENILENVDATISKKEDMDEEKIEVQKKTIINSISDCEDEYTTYNVHIVRQMETIESISQNYNVPVEIIKEYNNIDSINIGDKIIIPKEIDE